LTVGNETAGHKYDNGPIEIEKDREREREKALACKALLARGTKLFHLMRMQRKRISRDAVTQISSSYPDFPVLLRNLGERKKERKREREREGE